MSIFNRSHIYIGTIIVCMLFNVLNGCTYNKGEEPVPFNSNVSYAVDVKPVLITHCYKCHSDTATNPDRPGYAFFNDFDEIQGVALKASTANPNYTVLIARLKHIESPGMPYLQSPLSDSLIQVIQDWVLVGAPNN